MFNNPNFMIDEQNIQIFFYFGRWLRFNANKFGPHELIYRACLPICPLSMAGTLFGLYQQDPEKV